MKGYKLVPIVPTDAMLYAASWAVGPGGVAETKARIAKEWAAAVAAAMVTAPVIEKVPFKDLAYGAKFKYEYIDGESEVLVKIGHNEVAEWREENVANRWIGQGIYAFGDDPGLLVQLVRDAGSPAKSEFEEGLDIIGRASTEVLRKLNHLMGSFEDGTDRDIILTRGKAPKYGKRPFVVHVRPDHRSDKPDLFFAASSPVGAIEAAYEAYKDE